LYLLLADLDIFMYAVVLYMEMLRCGYMMDASFFVCRGIGRPDAQTNLFLLRRKMGQTERCKIELKLDDAGDISLGKE
jgi:hypothetical protein